MLFDIFLGVSFIIFLIMLITMGAFSFFFPHKAIEFNLKLANKMNFLKVKPPIDPHGTTMVGYYRTVGFLMLCMVGCPLILAIFLTLKVIIGGGDICVGNDVNCITF